MTEIFACGKKGLEKVSSASGGKKVWILAKNGEETEEILTSLGIENGFFTEIVNKGGRARVYESEGRLIILLRKPKNHGSTQISLMLGENFLLSAGDDDLSAVKGALDKGASDRDLSLEHLLYLILDYVMDSFYNALDNIEDKAEKLEEELISRPDDRTVKKIYTTSRELIRLRRLSWPLREVFAALNTEKRLGKEKEIYFRDLYEREIQLTEGIEVYSEMLTEMLDVYLSSVNNRMNEIIKLLTIIATISIPITLITGIYGMNFKNMPELSSPYGYPSALISMTAIALLMIFYFRKKKWM
jgi:magnesium transporter